MTKTMIKYGVAALLVFMLTGCGIYKKYELPAETPVVSDYAKALQEQQDSTSLGNLSWREVFTTRRYSATYRQRSTTTKTLTMPVSTST